MIRGNAVDIVNGYGLKEQGTVVRFPEQTRDLYFSKRFRPVPEPTQLPIQRVPGACLFVCLFQHKSAESKVGLLHL